MKKLRIGKYTTKLTCLTLIIVSLIPTQINAAIPSEYDAIVIKSAFSFTERVFDLTPAVDRARKEDKNLFLYLGAADCPPCKEYEIFIRKNYQNLKEDFSKVVIGDIQTWINGPKIFFIIDGEKITINEFKKKIGDQNKLVFYPTYWLIDTNLKQIRQFPRGNKEFLDLETHKNNIR